MDKRLDRIEIKLDDMHEDLVEVKHGYQIHERRSLANEQAISILREESKPIHDLLQQIKAIHRIAVWLGGTSAFVLAVLEIIKLLK